MKKVIFEIIELCLQIDKAANLVYKEFSTLTENIELKTFWHQMSEEEKLHIEFWERILKQGKHIGLPQIFDHPQKVKAELSYIVPKVKQLLSRCRETNSISDAFLAAFRLEFYLLHPAFESLFHVMRHLADGPCPEDQYEEHINRFIDIFSENEKVSPEMELLGETLQHLWKENRKLAQKASHDYLTGLFIRQTFFEIVHHLANLARRQNNTVAIMMIDVDHFKNINDNYGHSTGDLVLRAIARVLQSSVRAADIVGRYGGEEFIVFMPETSKGAPTLVAERIRNEVFKAKPENKTVTVSIGIAKAKLASDPAKEISALIDLADKRLYAAKAAGRNKVISSG